MIYLSKKTFNQLAIDQVEKVFPGTSSSLVLLTKGENPSQKKISLLNTNFITETNVICDNNVKVISSYNKCFIILSNGDVYAYGLNYKGQLGIGQKDEGFFNQLMKVNGLPPISDIVIENGTTFFIPKNKKKENSKLTEVIYIAGTLEKNVFNAGKNPLRYDTPKEIEVSPFWEAEKKIKRGPKR